MGTTKVMLPLVQEVNAKHIKVLFGSIYNRYTKIQMENDNITNLQHLMSRIKQKTISGDIYSMEIIEVMTNETIANNFLNWFSQNYTMLKYKYAKYCKLQNYEFDEDIFSDTYMKIYDIIIKKGMKDTSEKGFDNYTFKAFKNNILNEKNYSRNKKRDRNITSDNINEIYEKYYNNTFDSSRVKLMGDLFNDFAILYIMTKVEDNFDSEHFYLYKMKTLMPNMTFKKLAETTNIKASRLKVIEVQRWIKANIKKEDVRKAFFAIYGDLID
jgi:hypothetical protein